MRVIDSHTEGEPTRTVISGGPDLAEGSLAERAERLQDAHKEFMRSVLCEPRGHDAIVGAYLLPPSDPSCAAGVIFFNPVGKLGMCGHGTIGLVATLAHMGRIEPGEHRIETPVGIVSALLAEDKHTVTIRNVESYRLHKDVTVSVDGLGDVTGDVAWGGNWFFLTKIAEMPLETANLAALTDAAVRIRNSLSQSGITGADGAYIDHIEFFGPSSMAGAHAKNFVLCPGLAFDRSPCGTGCSAKLACLAEDGLVGLGEAWVQESIIGSSYRLKYDETTERGIVPTLAGRAFVVAESELLFDPSDPYGTGVSF